MRKVVTISLNGRACQVEEAGSGALDLYLQDAARTLAGNPDLAEILTDLEQALSDRCQDCLHAHKDVVSSEDVARILAAMGPVEPDGPSREGPTAATPPNEAPPSTPRSFFRRQDGSRRPLRRIPSEGMLGGVCAGVAAFIGVDLVWVRLVFLALLVLTGGSFAILWLAMWVMMPRAVTPDDTAAVRGEPLNARDILDRTRRRLRRFQHDRQLDPLLWIAIAFILLWLLVHQLPSFFDHSRHSFQVHLP
jgi:phage shock protein PspC (stress-responsive transcriptional regulator)